MLYVEPHAGPAPVIQVIEQAHRGVDLNVYYLSDRPILAALARAERRGVRVRIILDKKPYGMKPWAIRRELKSVKEVGAEVHWAPPRFEARPGHWVFDHAKYVCNGHECEIGTANFDWSAFHRNREYLDVTHAPTVVKAALAVFQADWTGRRAGAYAHWALVLSPGSEPKLQALIDQPGQVDIESEEMGTDRAILEAIAAKGREARVILPASISAQDRRNVEWLESRGVQVRLLKKSPIYMHAKMIVGARESFIGSENFSASSLNLNREMGLVLSGGGRLAAQFDRDWARARR